MISTVFLKIMNMGINASWLILAVIAARLLLKKAPKWITCLMWALVAFRLLCPVSIKSVISLLPSGEVIPTDIGMEQNPHIYSGISAVDNTINPMVSGALAPDPLSSVNPMQVVLYAAGIIWVSGLALMMIYALVSYLSVRRKVRISAPVADGVREGDNVRSPFILGIIHPVIYVPSGMDKDTFEYVTAHERAHLKRMDHLWKPLGFVLLAVYWFNPLCWMAYILLCRDIEAACDEKVISDKDRKYMAAYSQALLDCSLQRRTIAACPLAFGETDVRGRIKGILNYKKPAFWVVIASALICIAVGVCFVTDPEMRDVAAASSDADIPVVSISDEDMVTGVTEPESEQTYENPGNRYMYTGNTGPVADGVWIDFAIALKSDGTYTWYESPVSSYIGVGTYSVEDGVLVMRDDETVCTPRVNRFRISGDSLYYISEESDNFMMVQLSDGEEFVRDDITIPEYPADNVSENMLSHKPVDNMMITAGFDAASHRETDFAGPVGEPVYAVCDGSVIYTGYDAALGNYIVIVPSVTTPAIKITYSHLDSSDVNEGDTVKAGDVIGSIGNTGRSTGPHLGLEMKIDDVPVDIIPYLEEIGD